MIKVTTDPERLRRAALEAQLLSSGEISDVAPELVASAQGTGWVAVATRRGRPLAPATQLTRETWLSLATSLAALHRRAPEGDLLQRQPVPVAASAHGAWKAMGAEDAADRGIRRLADAPTSALPVVLVHGDSHVGNIIHDHDGAPLWIDWQEAHLGDGLADLVFLWQRGEFAGARPPRVEMTARYAQQRSIHPDQLQERLDLAELRLLLHSWPPFLEHGSPMARETMRRRLVALSSR